MAMIPMPDWRVSPGLTPYPTALAEMDARAAAIAAGEASELIWLVEHPPLYTAGTSAAVAELIDPHRFPVFSAGRGGRYTYHGPGQRVGYLMIDLNARGRDVRRFVHALEGWLIATLARFGIAARAVPERVGIWVDDRAGDESKIGAIGVRVRKWVTLHGFSLNLAPELEHFAGIVPCGLADRSVTSLHALGIKIGMDALDAALHKELPGFLAALASGRNT